jgi:hypothetical protein
MRDAGRGFERYVQPCARGARLFVAPDAAIQIALARTGVWLYLCDVRLAVAPAI